LALANLLVIVRILIVIIILVLLVIGTIPAHFGGGIIDEFGTYKHLLLFFFVAHW
jgi:hypothetical protein